MDTGSFASDTTKPSVLVLLSGGIDSSTCVHYYVSHGYQVSALFVHYGQPDAELEQAAATTIAEHYRTPLRRITISNCEICERYIPARNALLLCAALMNFHPRAGIVALGIHAGTTFSDCSPEFVRIMQSMFDLYEDGRIRVEAPFLHWTKSAIWDYARGSGVPLQWTHSNNLSDLRPPVA